MRLRLPISNIINFSHFVNEWVSVGDNSHIFLFEQGGSASIGGVASRPIRTEPDGTLPIESILASVRVDNVHFPVTQLVCLEQTHNMFG